jgi:hypothetical protein
MGKIFCTNGGFFPFGLKNYWVNAYYGVPFLCHSVKLLTQQLHDLSSNF